MTKALARPEDCPTHRLVVKIDEGKFKTFYLTEAEAAWMARNINSVEPNIVFTAELKHIDPAAPSFYPKRGAWLERMTREEIDARVRHFEDKAQAAARRQAEEDEAARRKERARMRAEWRAQNPQEYERLLAEARAAVEKNGYAAQASKGAREYLVQYETLRLVEEAIDAKLTSP